MLIADESKAVISSPSSWRCCSYASVIDEIYLKVIRIMSERHSVKTETHTKQAKSISEAVASNVSFPNISGNQITH
jgi:hypothetical protein